ncbi:MAG: response regulator, partial [Clostridia bacterium]|nr:response regulator [Clostridia bacterium]
MYTVLVCDDDIAILDSLQIYLELEGYQVLRAENGRQAIEQVAAHTVHCAILDIMMPGLDG